MTGGDLPRTRIAAVDSPNQLRVEWGGREAYHATWQRQLELRALRCEGRAPDTLILVEHEPVVTVGRHGDSGNLLLPEAQLRQRGVELFRVERGGDVTFHGPGQLVGYPIISLARRGLSVRELMRNLEEALIRAVGEFGIAAGREPGMTGVWHERCKLAALGVAVQGGVSFHGFALNVDPDLSYFQLIVPCGIVGRAVTSMAEVLGHTVALSDVRPVCVRHICDVFGYTAG